MKYSPNATCNSTTSGTRKWISSIRCGNPAPGYNPVGDVTVPSSSTLLCKHSSSLSSKPSLLTKVLLTPTSLSLELAYT